MGAGFGLAMLALGLLAAFSNREAPTAAAFVALLAAGPILAARFPTRLWLVAGAQVVLTFLLPWPNTDRLTLVLAYNLIIFYPGAGEKLLVASATLMVLAGHASLHSGYVLIASAWVLGLTGWLALRHRRMVLERKAARRARTRDWLRTGIQLGLSIAIGGSLAAWLPDIEKWAIERAANLPMPRSSGFGAYTNLSSVDSIHQSSRMALRIYEAGPTLMRGAAYSHYHDGVWKSARTTTERYVPRTDGAGPWVRVVSALDGERNLFVPLEASEVRSTRDLLVDEADVLTCRDPAPGWLFRRGPVRRGGTLDAKARAEYLEVPPAIAGGIGSIVREITKRTTTPRQRASAILYDLGVRCAYSLEPGRPGAGEEPVVRFVAKTHQGHCEYFASAMALMARLAGVPARYVAGYSAVERNPFGGYLMARDADAHAWVETWIDGEGWMVWDPTPPEWRAADGEKKSRLAEWMEQLADYLSDRLAAFLGWFRSSVAEPLGEWFVRAGRTLGGRVGGALALILLALWGRPLWRRFAMLAAILFALQPRVEAGGGDLSPATRALGRLEKLLGRAGVHRPVSTTPLELAARLDPAGLPPEVKGAVTELIDQICRVRYGGSAWDEARAAACLTRLERELTKAGPAR